MFTGIPHINNMDEDQLTCHRLKHLWAGTIAITTLWIQFASLSMLCPTPATAATQKAHWNNKEVQVLLEFLKSQASTSEGTGNFKEKAFNGIINPLKPLLTQGPVKMAKMCFMKWTNVCIMLRHIDS